MKLTFKIILVLSLFSGILLMNSCNKKSCDEPCNASIEVFSTERDQFYLGHFILNETYDGSFAPSQTYLFANNWAKFSSQIKPGRKYLLAFKYVSCDHQILYNSFNYDTTFRCGTPVFKCIEILCIKEAPIPKCYGLKFNSSEISNYYSRAISGSSIEGNSLKTNAFFSGCNQIDPVDFLLMLNELPTLGPLGQPIFEAKVSETNRMLCNAVFQKSVCFDLSEIDGFYKKNNRATPNEVIILLYEGDSSIELHYNPIS